MLHRGQGALTDLGHFGQGVLKHVVQDPRRPNLGGQLVQGRVQRRGQLPVIALGRTIPGQLHGGLTVHLTAPPPLLEAVLHMPDGDAAQPGPHAFGLLELVQIPVTVQESVLHDVVQLVVVAEEAIDRARHVPTVAMVEPAEGLPVPAAHRPHQGGVVTLGGLRLCARFSHQP
jgi:hypothetical protein